MDGCMVSANGRTLFLIKSTPQWPFDKYFFIIDFTLNICTNTSNFVYTYDIYIKNTKLYIYNWILFFYLEMSENKNAFWQQSEKVNVLYIDTESS